MPCVEEANEACAFSPHPLHYPHRSKCRRDIFHVFQPGSEESVHMRSRSHSDRWKLLTISDCLHKLIFILSIVYIHTQKLHQFSNLPSSQTTVFSAVGFRTRGLETTAGPLYGADPLNTKGHVSCNPTELFHPNPKGHLANYLPKHILKLQIIGAVWY